MKASHQEVSFSGLDCFLCDLQSKYVMSSEIEFSRVTMMDKHKKQLCCKELWVLHVQFVMESYPNPIIEIFI